MRDLQKEMRVLRHIIDNCEPDKPGLTQRVLASIAELYDETIKEHLVGNIRGLSDRQLFLLAAKSKSNSRLSRQRHLR